MGRYYLRVVTKDSAINIAMARQLRAERAAHPEMTMADISALSGVSIGTLNRILGKDEASIRDVNISVIVNLARAFDVSAEELVEAAVRRADRAMSEADSNIPTDEDFEITLVPPLADQVRLAAKKGQRK